MANEDRLMYTRSAIYPWDWLQNDTDRIPSHEDLHLFFDSVLHNAKTNIFGQVELDRDLSNALELLKIVILRTCSDEQSYKEMESAQPFAFFAQKNNALLAFALVSQFEAPTFLLDVPTKKIKPAHITADILRKLGGITKTYVYDDAHGYEHEMRYSIPENLLNFLGRSTHIFHEIFGEIPTNGIVTLSEVNDMFKSQSPELQQIAILAYLRDNVLPVCHMIIQSGAIEDLPHETSEYFLDRACDDINAEIAKLSTRLESPKVNPDENVRILERKFIPEALGPNSQN